MSSIRGMSSEKRMQALEMVARGEELEDILRVLAASGAGENTCPAAMLILQDDRVYVGASVGLSEEQAGELNRLLLEPFVDLEELALRLGAKMRPLVSGASEILGAIALLGDPSGWEDSLSEVTSIAALAIEQKNLQQELSYRADHDALTGMWNGQRMGKEIRRALTARRRSGGAIGLVCVDLDRFRLINDILGHHVGDEVLLQVAGRLEHAVEPGVSVARVRGDEFLVMAEDIGSEQETRALGERLVECMQEPFQIGAHSLSVTASAGACTGGIGDFDGDDFQASTYMAVRYAKKGGRNRVVEYDHSMAAAPPERLEMERHLRSALAHGELLVHYQPQIELATGQTVGFEALARWKHPSIGFISPATFIPLAEEIGVVEELGRWVFREAVKQIRGIRQLEGLDQTRMSVNVSGLQIARPGFSEWVIAEMDDAGLDPGAVELEITESVVMKDFKHVLKQMEILRHFGVMFAIDDFGTGHSSLAYLQELPFERLKIDQKFVRDIQHGEDRPPVLANIVHLAHALGVPAIAEGIETREQAEALLDMQCEVGQGYLFAKPMAITDLLQWAKKQIGRPAKAVIRSTLVG